MTKKLKFTCLSHGLLPFDDDSRIWLNGRNSGELVEVDVKGLRNSQFHKKYFSLLNVAFDWWNPDVVNFNGREVEKNLDRFRKDIIIQTGRYTPVVNTKGEVRCEAQSISFANMDQIEFEKLYNDTITVLLKILPSHIREEDLRNAEASLMEFC